MFFSLMRWEWPENSVWILTGQKYMVLENFGFYFRHIILNMEKNFRR